MGHWFALDSLFRVQPKDVFASDQGKPDVVKSRVLKIQQMLHEPSLALHWYEWDHIKFDTVRLTTVRLI